jgi:hypothetical protein
MVKIEKSLFIRFLKHPAFAALRAMQAGFTMRAHPATRPSSPRGTHRPNRERTPYGFSAVCVVLVDAEGRAAIPPSA